MFENPHDHVTVRDSLGEEEYQDSLGEGEVTVTPLGLIEGVGRLRESLRITHENHHLPFDSVDHVEMLKGSCSVGGGGLDELTFLRANLIERNREIVALINELSTLRQLEGSTEVLKFMQVFQASTNNQQ